MLATRQKEGRGGEKSGDIDGGGEGASHYVIHLEKKKKKIEGRKS